MEQDTAPPLSAQDTEPALLDNRELVTELSRTRRELARVALGPTGEARRAELEARHTALNDEYAKRAAPA